MNSDEHGWCLSAFIRVHLRQKRPLARHHAEATIHKEHLTRAAPAHVAEEKHACIPDLQLIRILLQGCLGPVVLELGADTKQNLSFPLLSDPDCTLLKPLGAFGRKVMYGKEMEGIIRSTFLVDPKGIVRHVWPKVSVKGHVEEVLDMLGTFQKN
jgi:hypothetical protein